MIWTEQSSKYFWILGLLVDDIVISKHLYQSADYSNVTSGSFLEEMNKIYMEDSEEHIKRLPTNNVYNDQKNENYIPNISNGKTFVRISSYSYVINVSS